MATTKGKSKASANLVVAPPRPAAPAEKIRATRAKSAGTKQPLDPRENPLARNSSGKATRAEIRREEVRHSAPRQTNRTPERSGQSRSHPPKKKSS
jgi:hypothetical protein